MVKREGGRDIFKIQGGVKNSGGFGPWMKLCNSYLKNHVLKIKSASPHIIFEISSALVNFMCIDGRCRFAEVYFEARCNI